WHYSDHSLTIERLQHIRYLRNVYILLSPSLRNVMKCKQINFKLLHLLATINYGNASLVLNNE
ncbi:MAG: hypothetical protein ACK54G_02725, partial [Pseudanabaena sp.]